MLEDLYVAYQKAFRPPPLSQGRRFVPGQGNANEPPLMFIGEAPGATEDRKGVPFVGRAGNILSEMLGELGMDRSQVFVTNTVKYRPTEGEGRTLRNRAPTTAEVQASRPFLVREIAIVRPVVVVPLGHHGLTGVLPGKGSIGRWHGQLLRQSNGDGGRPVFPMYHPMYVGYGGRAARLQMWQDIDRLKEIIAGLPTEEN